MKKGWWKIDYTIEPNDADLEHIAEEIKRLKEKLKQIKKICLTNAKIWNETEHDPVEEFKLLAKIIDEK